MWRGGKKTNTTDLHKYFLKQANILFSGAVRQTEPQNWLQLGHPMLSLRRFDNFRFKNAKKKWKLRMNRLTEIFQSIFKEQTFAEIPPGIMKA